MESVEPGAAARRCLVLVVEVGAVLTVLFDVQDKRSQKAANAQSWLIKASHKEFVYLGLIAFAGVLPDMIGGI